jgi:probable phosphoglycerate mutase
VERVRALSPVVAVITSPMRRARQTADILAGELGLEVEEMSGLRECAFGEWDGLTFAEVSAGWPERLATWLADPTVTAPGGESFDEVRRRVSAARDEVVERHAQQAVLVVTHVTPVKLLVADVLGAPPSAVYRMELAPASLTEVEWYAGGAASLRRFNDVAHVTP